ncbi:MAG: GGDEF domain-containing protein [Actinomycetota bacterium]|nr:GGDEF domain-containing protein [Actinomycetota bacterium]
MTAETAANPERRERARPPASAGTTAAALTRAFFAHPNLIATAFWAGGAVAVVSALVLVRWSHRSFLALAVLAGVCALGSVLRLLVGGRLPSWALCVDAGVATVVTSLLAAVGATNEVHFAYLYVWVVLFAALYFRPPAALACMAGVGVAYALVLVLGPRVDEPTAAWLALVGTASVGGLVVLGLTSMLRATARTDPLTGLANRRMWDERVEEEMGRSVRSGTALSVVMVDLDGFKAINDAGGHDAGDRLLQDLARAWRGVVRGGGDFLARLGGDEFGLLAPGSDEIGARALAKRLSNAIPEGVSASVGVASWDRTEGASDLLRRADQVMYRNKRRHRRGAPPGPA